MKALLCTIFLFPHLSLCKAPKCQEAHRRTLQSPVGRIPVCWLGRPTVKKAQRRGTDSQHPARGPLPQSGACGCRPLLPDAPQVTLTWGSLPSHHLARMPSSPCEDTKPMPSACRPHAVHMLSRPWSLIPSSSRLLSALLGTGTQQEGGTGRRPPPPTKSVSPDLTRSGTAPARHT